MLLQDGNKLHIGNNIRRQKNEISTYKRLVVNVPHTVAERLAFVWALGQNLDGQGRDRPGPFRAFKVLSDLVGVTHAIDVYLIYSTGE